MPSVAVKLYSVFFKFLLKHRLQSKFQAPIDQTKDPNHFGVSTRPDESIAASNPSFVEGVATKDIHIDPFTSLSIRIFIPDTCLVNSAPKQSKYRVSALIGLDDESSRRNSYDSSNVIKRQEGGHVGGNRRYSYASVADPSKPESGGSYRGYLPSGENYRKLPVMLQFHGGGFVSGSSESVANDLFCRRIAKLCDVIVVAVGYRLAPENRFPDAFEDGMKVLHWLAKQSNLAECGKSMGNARGVGAESRKGEVQRHIADSFGASMVEPWLAAHGDLTRCVLLGVSCGANIADYVARKSVEAGRMLDPVKVVAQVLMYPFFIGSVPTHSEIRLANSYFYDKPMGPPLKRMPPTLTVVAEHDWMRDRAIAYSEELRKVNVDAPVLEYKDAVHEFATLDMLLKTPQAQACAEDIAIWVKKYISLRGHEFSY
ncbi:CXE carboxylesterase [Heracleum sosnowskyi]|uniref:CXE carboxylesterase n=1 Tax=Heracleum sosnowskyi TaxID=360622 RepID=A0AAD8NC62_9APIA|nr:CXE carboxylesterase [Heracleum sosnowskyi]